MAFDKQAQENEKSCVRGEAMKVFIFRRKPKKLETLLALESAMASFNALAISGGELDLACKKATVAYTNFAKAFAKGLPRNTRKAKKILNREYRGTK